METQTRTDSPRYGILNGNALKLIALITMLIDHVGASLIEGGVYDAYYAGALSLETALRWQSVDQVLRAVGRVSFPIYCFLLIEGFLHTRSVKKYAARLAVFALVSEIPYDMAFYHTWFSFEMQNVFCTLFLGLAGLAALEYYKENRIWGVLAFAGCAGMAEVLQTDYGAFGVIFIGVLYVLRNRVWIQTAVGSAFLLWEPAAVFAFIPIRMYNGRRGKWNLKYFFYLAYPLHLLILHVIWRILFLQSGMVSWGV